MDSAGDSAAAVKASATAADWAEEAEAAAVGSVAEGVQVDLEVAEALEVDLEVAEAGGSGDLEKAVEEETVGLAGAGATGETEVDLAEAETGSAAEGEDSAEDSAVAPVAVARRPFLSRIRTDCFRRKTLPVSECRKCLPSKRVSVGGLRS